MENSNIPEVPKFNSSNTKDFDLNKSLGGEDIIVSNQDLSNKDVNISSNTSDQTLSVTNETKKGIEMNSINPNSDFSGDIINSKMPNNLENNIEPKAPNTPENIAPEVRNTLENIAPEITNTPENIAPEVPNTPENIAPEVPNTPENIAPEVSNTPENIAPEVSNNSENIAPEVLNTPENIAPEVPNTPENIAPEVTNTPENIAPEVPNTPENIAPEVTNTPENIAPEVSNNSENIAPEVSNNSENIAPEVSNNSENIVPEVRNTPENIAPEVTNTPENIAPEVTNTPENIAPEVPSKPENIEPKAPNNLENIVEPQIPKNSWNNLNTQETNLDSLNKNLKKTWLEKNIPSLAFVINLFKKKETKNNVDLTFSKEKKKSFFSKVLSFFKPKNVSTDYTPTNILDSQEYSESKKGVFDHIYTVLVTRKDKLLFLDQMSTLLNSDIRIVDALRLLKQQTDKWAFKKLLDSMLKEVESGKPLSVSMSSFSSVFPPMWINLIKAGEASGKLSDIIKDLNKQQHDLEKLMGSVKGAMVYPGFIVLMLVVLMTVMMTTIVPQIEGIYKQSNVDLPTMTQLIINFSRFIIKNGIYVLLGVIAVSIITIFSVKKIYISKKTWDYIWLRFPVFGLLNRERSMVLFADNMQLLLSSGVLIGDALSICAEVVPSINYREEILRVREEISNGNTMSQSMGLIDIAKEKFKKNFYFPLEFAQMISVGEKTGNLVNVLSKIRDTYSEKVSNTVKNLSTLLEPMMIVIVGGLVGAFLLGIMLPFFKMGQLVS